MMATVSHLIRDASSGQVIFFRDPWRTYIVTAIRKIPKGLSSRDNSSLSCITEQEEDHPAWRCISKEMWYSSRHKNASPDDQNYLQICYITKRKDQPILDPTCCICIPPVLYHLSTVWSQVGSEVNVVAVVLACLRISYPHACARFGIRFFAHLPILHPANWVDVTFNLKSCKDQSKLNAMYGCDWYLVRCL